MKRLFALSALLCSTLLLAQPQTQTPYGTLQGKDLSGVHAYLGVPYAAPPVGPLRWRAPQPPMPWKGTLEATDFGAKAMQLPLYGDMNFRSTTMSEDCLYLNIWTPKDAKKAPVLVYFYGGGFQAGDGSEPRYDGESMARNGVVTVTITYRLGVFGGFSHPELTQEDPFSAGNQGLMDQSAALKWVHENIAAFGGDPKQITIAGESAGSMSVSAQVASPLSQPYITRAIGESGSLVGKIFGGDMIKTLDEAEKVGTAFQEKSGTPSLSELRALSGEKILELSAGYQIPFCVDGHFLPQTPEAIYSAGKQARVPLLAGWNSQEMTYMALTGGQEIDDDLLPTLGNQFFQDQGPATINAYLQTSDGDIEQAAMDLSGDFFLGYCTWYWMHLHEQTSGQPVYRYYYKRPRPAMRPELGNVRAGLAGGVVEADPSEAAERAPLDKGAVHSAEIEYCMGNLRSNRVFDWTEDDYRISEIMQTQFLNFIQTGNPNGATVPNWPEQKEGQVMIIDVHTQSMPEYRETRYQQLHKALNP